MTFVCPQKSRVSQCLPVTFSYSRHPDTLTFQPDTRFVLCWLWGVCVRERETDVQSDEGPVSVSVCFASQSAARRVSWTPFCGIWSVCVTGEKVKVVSPPHLSSGDPLLIKFIYVSINLHVQQFFFLSVIYTFPRFVKCS